MLSRIADSLFWLNRYMERANGLLRLCSTHYNFSLDKDVHANTSWRPVLEVFAASDPEEIAALENNTEKVLKKLLIDANNSNSLKTLVIKTRENARGAQDHITKEVWEQVNEMYHLINQPSLEQKLNTHQGLEVIEQFKKHTVLFTGTTEITMSRGKGWQFMNLGKYVERCLQTIVITRKQMEIINKRQAMENDILQWRYLLLSLSGYELYLKTHSTTNHNNNVFHQVLLDENFTRSVIYSLNHIQFYLDQITHQNINEETSALLKSFGRLHSKVKFLDLNVTNNGNLQPYLKEIELDLIEFSKLFSQYFFSYT